MILYSRVTEIPDSEPVDLTIAKSYLTVVGDSENALINTLIKSARRMAENYTGLSIVTQERTIKLNYFPCYSLSNPRQFITIPYGPVQSITAFTYTNTDGDEIELVEGTDYLLDDHAQPARVYAIDTGGEITTWPSTKRVPNAVSIVYQAGYDDVSGEATPEEVKTAILRQVKMMYDKREDDPKGVIGFEGSVTDLCLSSRMMLDSFKVYWNANL